MKEKIRGNRKTCESVGCPEEPIDGGVAVGGRKVHQTNKAGFRNG